MAAYSYHPHHFLLSSAFIPNTAPFDISSFPSNLLIPSTEFSPMETRRESFSDAVVYQNSCHDRSSKMHSATSSIDMEKVEEKKSRKGSSLHSTQSKRRKVQGKTKKEKKVNIGENVEEKTPKAKASKKSVMECSEDALKDYIHVRARRGQATDSHSLAERVRRERISERMKMLQALVPGCETVTGKALMLDEIINYVQSLQNQIEFLSMKLASFNPIYSNFALDLDGAILKQDQRLIALAASQPSGSTSSQLCSPTTVNYNSSTNTITARTTGFHPLIESSLLLQQEAAENLAWNQIDNQTQNFMNQSGLGNGMCSFQ